jgi:two-component system CheB/CheR fusion protein
MGRTHDLLAQRNWRGADLADLLRATLLVYASKTSRNIELHGPKITLTPNAAATLGMVLHELATNAAKYGSLSRPDGRVEVTWEVVQGHDGDELSLTWAERNGPPAEKSAAPGFGTSFIERSVAYELRGSSQMDFRPEGLYVAITVPFGHNIERDPPSGRPDAAAKE